MKVSVYLRYLSLLTVGLLAGNSFAFVMGFGSAMEKLSAESYIELHECLDMAFSAWTPLLYVMVVLFVSSNLILLRKEWRSLEFILIAFALICILDELAMTWTGNLPLSRMIHSWHTLSPPSAWSEVRGQWLRFMYIRSALLVVSFGLLLASSFFMKRTLPYPRDVFAVA